MTNVDVFNLVTAGEVIHTRDGKRYVKLSGKCDISIATVCPGLLCEIGTGDVLSWTDILPSTGEFDSYWCVEGIHDKR
jgi:hypothetical protein